MRQKRPRYQPAAPAPDLTGKTAYKVQRVDDDYTMFLTISGKETPVRLLGLASIQTEGAEGTSQTVHEGIKQFVQNLLKGEFVYLDYDSQLEQQDADGQAVAYVYRASEGYEFDHAETFRFYEQKSQVDKKGFWSMIQAE